MFRHKLFLIIVLFLFLALGLWGFWIEPNQVTVKNIQLKIPHWHQQHNNLKIAILTDLHVGAPHIDIEKLKHIVKRTNEQHPDLIILLGDFVISGVLGGTFKKPETIAKILKDLNAPLGIVTVLGNQDWWHDGPRVIKAMQNVGFIVLENQTLSITKNNKTFWLAGLADLMTRKPDIKGTLEKIPDNNPIVMLTHHPDVFPDIPSRVSLTLAGHTHGGQVNLPIIGRPIIPSKYGQRYAEGHIVEQGRHMYVSSGVGTSIIPVRFRVPPEIVIITIKSYN